MLKRVAALFLLAVVAPIASAQSVLERFQEGTHYWRIEPALPTQAPAGKVEVDEFFSYGCIHCATFQPIVDKWKATPAAQKAHFVYVPATFNAPFALFARGYYAADALGVREKTHQAMFDAVFVEQKQFRTIEEIADFYVAKAGIKKEDFLAAASSFTTETKLKRATKLLQEAGVDGTPNVVVAGKYRISGASAGGYDKLFDVVNFLVDKELAAAKK
jgi:protein dithiol oxidoreductase (disulfide-forming)